MKTNFFGLSFLLFLRLQIYEAIAAIFWQSASYVLSLANLRKSHTGYLLMKHNSPNWSLQLTSKMINCSQTKFVAIILVLLVFFYAIFRLTDFSSDAFDFSSSKTG